MEKGQTHWDGFDDKIISMYAGGMTVEEIRGHLDEIYGVTVSKDFISTVTDKVLDDVRAWQNRPIDDCYLVVWIDALVVKVRVDGVVRNRPAYLVLGLNMDGKKEALALVIGTGDGVREVLAEGPHRPPEPRPAPRCASCAATGSPRLPEAVEAVYARRVGAVLCRAPDPQLASSTSATRTASQIVKDLRPIYQAATEDSCRRARSKLSTGSGVRATR